MPPPPRPARRPPHETRRAGTSPSPSLGRAPAHRASVPRQLHAHRNRKASRHSRRGGRRSGRRMKCRAASYRVRRRLFAGNRSMVESELLSTGFHTGNMHLLEGHARPRPAPSPSRRSLLPSGRFFIDPVRPVDRALVTHGHSDHARSGHGCAGDARDAGHHALRYGEGFAGTTQAADLGESLASKVFP